MGADQSNNRPNDPPSIVKKSYEQNPIYHKDKTERKVYMNPPNRSNNMRENGKYDKDVKYDGEKW